jgi:hypothetical protein
MDGVGALVRRLVYEGAEPIVFGGFLRESAHHALRNGIRDVDLVVASGRIERFYSVFRPHVLRRTRFGGYVLRVGACRVDVWPLEETWAIRQGLTEGASVAGLLQSTFFTIEAMAVVPENQFGSWGMRLYDRGAITAIARRILDINLEENPFPDLCVLRTFVLSNRLQLSLSERLASYVRKHGKGIGARGLLDLQRAHYGSVRRSYQEFREWLEGFQGGKRQRVEDQDRYLDPGGPNSLDSQLELLTMTGAG